MENTNKKRIVIVGPAYPYRGGQALVEAHLFHTLTKLGYNCNTVSFTMLYPKIFFPGDTQFDTSTKTFFSHNSNIFRIINSVNPFTWYKAAKKIKSLQPHLVVFVWWMPFFGPCYTTIALLSKFFTKTKIAFLVENYISHENRWFDRWMCKLTFKQANAFICQSKYIQQNIAANHPNIPIHTTTLSVFDCYNFNEYNKATAKQFLQIKTEKVVLFFGLIRKYKGLDKLIESFDFINDKENTTLLIVGECYEEIDDYKKLIVKHNLQQHCILVDKFIANEHIEPYFKAADMVVLPYNSASQSGILMIAYGLNTPVIVNNVGGLPELVVPEKTGLIMPNNNPTTIASYINTFYSNYNEAEIEKNISKLNESLGYKNLDTIFGEILG